MNNDNSLHAGRQTICRLAGIPYTWYTVRRHDVLRRDVTADLCEIFEYDCYAVFSRSV